MLTVISVKSRLSLLLCLISIGVYATTLGNGFAYDDLSVITKNTIVSKGISAIPEILSTPYRWGFFHTSNDMYRPLSLVMFAIECQLFNGLPGLMHFINVMLYAACVLLLFLFLIDFLGGTRMPVAFVAALLFALHPIHTEVVANIKSRDELLCFFFSFLSLILFMRYTSLGKLSLFIAGVLSYLLAMFSKESAVFFLPVILLLFVFYVNEHKQRSRGIIVASVGVAAIFIFVRYTVLGYYNAGHIADVAFIDNQLIAAPSVSSRFATAVLISGKYLKMLAIPYPLICDYSFNSIPFTDISDSAVWASIAVYTVLIFAGVFRFFKYPKDPFAFCVLFLLASILGYSNMFFPVGAVMAERFLFFASVGFCLLIALVAERLIGAWSARTRLRTIVPAFVCVCVICVFVITVRNSEWRDSLHLYKADTQKSPSNARLHFFLGNELLMGSMGNDTEEGLHKAFGAIESLQTALRIHPGYTDARKVLGKAFFSLSKFDSAIYHFNQLLRESQADTEVLNNLNVVYFQAQKYGQAAAICKEIIAIDSTDIQQYNNAALCYLHMDLQDSAIHYLYMGLAKGGSSPNTYANLALAYKMKGAPDSARKYESIVRLYYPDFHIY